MNLVKISKDLSKKVDSINFGPDVKFIYNPLDYAWDPHK